MKRFSQLDALRTLAIFLVVTSHTDFLSIGGQGGVGVAIFFTLSGFLTMLSYIKNDKIKIDSFKELMCFYIKKVFRILPLYYVVLLGGFFIDKGCEITTWRTLFENMFFIKCTQHYWYLQQEVILYLITPIILYILYIFKQKLKLNNLVMATGLIVLGTLFRLFVTEDVFYLNGNGMHQYFRLSLFLVGIAVAFIYKEYTIKFKDKKDLHISLKIIFDVISIVLIALSVLSAHKIIAHISPDYYSLFVGGSYPFIISILTGILILMLLINNNGLLSKLFSFKVFATLSALSYGIYLSHMYLLQYYRSLSNVAYFFAVSFVSIAVALLLNKTIEKWCVTLSNKITNKIMNKEAKKGEIKALKA